MPPATIQPDSRHLLSLMNRLWIILVFAVALLPACTTRDYSDFQPIPAKGWAYNDAFTFEPELNDSLATATLLVAVCHNSNYLYSNLWLEVSRLDPDSIWQRDTLDLRLCDPYGRWLGSGFGAQYQYSDTVVRNVRVVTGHPVVVRHIMRVDTVKDIEQLGIQLLIH